ncbi:MAG: hypothetical protein HZB68_05875 [Candidatus Aenigmarchaeota archaeon]|nr:hypothetical protein [Candidatus Aenigmarchaeota archaeon]
MGKMTVLKAITALAILLFITLPVFNAFKDSEMKDFLILSSLAFIAAVFLYLNILYNSRAVYHQGF